MELKEGIIPPDQLPEVLKMWIAEARHSKGKFDIGKNEQWGETGWSVDLGNFVNQSTSKLKKEISQLKLGTHDVMEYLSKSGCGTEAYVFHASPMGKRGTLYMAAWSVPIELVFTGE